MDVDADVDRRAERKRSGSPRESERLRRRRVDDDDRRDGSDRRDRDYRKRERDYYHDDRRRSKYDESPRLSSSRRAASRERASDRRSSIRSADPSAALAYGSPAPDSKPKDRMEVDERPRQRPRPDKAETEEGEILNY